MQSIPDTAQPFLKQQLEALHCFQTAFQFMLHQVDERVVFSRLSSTRDVILKCICFTLTAQTPHMCPQIGDSIANYVVPVL